ncbi:helix-turn-helix domain-containing protein [Persicitalea sp.]|uniref:AlbA family DNA-binding domain-containing protein n=1 Tax=Persicitalea sp. TaxID=3100273 RepID=UPI00359483CC
MITTEEISILIAAGEGYNAEFKVAVPNKVKELTEEICAFANAAGGVVLLGVNDANQVIGLTLDNTRRSAIQNSISDITPPLRCALSVVELDGKTIDWGYRGTFRPIQALRAVGGHLHAHRPQHPKAHDRRANAGFLPAVRKNLF